MVAESMFSELMSNGLSVLQEHVLKYVFPKTRARARYKAQLKVIVESFNACLERSTSSGIYDLMSDFQRAGDAENEPFRIVVEANSEKAILLSEWYYKYKTGFDDVKIGGTANLFMEFAGIINHTQRIFDLFARKLDPVALAKFKKISSGYPRFKQTYVNALNDFDKLSKEAKTNMPEIHSGYALCLPEI